MFNISDDLVERLSRIYNYRVSPIFDECQVCIALAQSFVQSLDGTGPMAVGLMVILNGINGDPSTDAGTLDLLVQVAVAEPASLAMLGLGLAGLGAARRRPRSTGGTWARWTPISRPIST